MHCPKPLAPLNAEFWDQMYTDFMSARTVFVNGYAFTTGLQPPPPTPEIQARGVADVWTNDYLPRIQAACHRLRTTDYDRMSLAPLGGVASEAMSESVAAFGYTMKPITGFMGPTFELVGFVEKELGPEGPQIAA